MEAMHMWMDWNAMGPFAWTMMILLWAAAVALVIWAVASLRGTPSPSEPTPLELLERRFAAGEIDQQDFEERKRLLGHP